MQARGRLGLNEKQPGRSIQEHPGFWLPLYSGYSWLFSTSVSFASSDGSSDGSSGGSSNGSSGSSIDAGPSVWSVGSSVSSGSDEVDSDEVGPPRSGPGPAAGV